MLSLFIKIKSFCHFNFIKLKWWKFKTSRLNFITRRCRAVSLMELLMVIFLMSLLVVSSYPLLRSLRIYQHRVADKKSYTFFDSELRTLLEELTFISPIKVVKNDVISFDNDINLRYKNKFLYLDEKKVLKAPLLLFEKAAENLLRVKIYYGAQSLSRKHKNRFYELFIHL